MISSTHYYTRPASQKLHYPFIPSHYFAILFIRKRKEKGRKEKSDPGRCRNRFASLEQTLFKWHLVGHTDSSLTALGPGADSGSATPWSLKHGSSSLLNHSFWNWRKIESPYLRLCSFYVLVSIFYVSLGESQPSYLTNSTSLTTKREKLEKG